MLHRRRRPADANRPRPHRRNPDRPGPSRAGRAAEAPRGARGAAFAVLSQYQLEGRFVSALLDETAARIPDFSADDRRLAVELIHGVVRRQTTLDALIEPHVRRPRHRIEGELWTLLRLGAYQLAFLERIPAYAAVNETVALAKTVGRKGWDGFVNGVLRNIQPMLTDRFSDEPSADAIPIGDGRFRLCTREIFDRPSADPVGYVAAAFSLPRWLLERWRGECDFGELCRLGFWFDKPAPFCLRVNPLKACRDDVLELFRRHGIACQPGGLSESIRLSGTLPIDSMPGFGDGLFSVQDESAMHAVDLLSPRSGETILDLCAAPGVKTTQIAERMQNTGTVMAADIRPDRLARIDENCRRLGISIIRSALVSPDGENLPPGPFDAVLVDVPCSNTGVLGKRPEARWRLKPTDIEELARLQRRLLEAACRRLKPGGRVVYSTCSIEPEENERVVHSIVEKDRDLAVVCQRRHVPGRPADGGFQALLECAGTAVRGHL